MRIIFILFTLGLSIFTFAAQISAQISIPSPNTKRLVFKLSTPIFSLKDVGSYTHEKLLTCQPAINGSYEFTSKRSLTLYPSHSLQAGQAYKCNINKSKYPNVNLDEASFTTEKLYAVMQRFGKMISLTFNTKVDLKKLEDTIKISRVNKLSTTNLSFDLSTTKNGEHFIALIKEDIKNDNLKVTINASISNSLNDDISKELSVNKSFTAPLDPKRSTMTIRSNPRFLAKDDGKLAIRVYLPYYYDSQTLIRPFIAVKGMKNFSVTSPKYLYPDERKKYNLSSYDRRSIDINGDFKPNKSYEITIKRGLKSAYDYQIRKDQKFTVHIKDRKKYISFKSNKPYLSSVGTVAIKSVNIKKATVVIEHLLDQNYRYFTTFKAGNKNDLNSMVVEVARKTFTINGSKNKFSNYNIDIKSFIKKFRSGVYRFTIHYNGDKQTSKSLYFSDIGITTKVANNQMLIWATKLSNSLAIKNANIKIYSDKNELLKKAKTDKDGIAIIKLKDIAFKNPKTVVVSTEKEQNFLYLDKKLNETSTPYYKTAQKKYKTFIYLQSKLVRPGNNAHILIILKDKDFIAGANLPLKITITDPKGYKVYNQSLKTAENGDIDLKYFIGNDFKTGKYRIKIKLASYEIGASSFSVENFLPQKIKNKIKFNKKFIQAGELLYANLSSKYLFGAFASNLKAKVQFSAVSKIYYNEAFKGFYFNNEILAKSNVKNYILQNKSVKLDAKGKAKILFDTTISQTPSSILQAQLALTVFDDGRGVSTYKTIDIYPFKSMVGVKLEKKTIEKGKKLLVKTVAIEPSKARKLSRKLEVIIKKGNWVYMYDNQGYYRWHERYEEYNRFYIQSGDEINLVMPNSGDYILIVADHLSKHSTTRRFSVRGWDYTPINPTSDMGKIQIKIDKAKMREGFSKGDTLHVNVKSPLLKGNMLLSLEDTKVRWHKVIAINKGTASLDIPINFNIPNGAYFRTHMVRATNTPSKLIPFRASSVTFLKPNLTSSKQIVSIKAPNITTSNHDQIIKVNARANSFVLLSIIDDGILQIKNQLPPKPFQFFQRIIGERVTLFDLFNEVTNFKTKGTMLSFGGDKSMAMKRSRKHLSPNTGAKRVKPFVYWSHIVPTNANGDATFKLPIPSFNGKATMVAIAFNKSSIGVASKSITIKDDIIIKPTFPRFAYINDILKIPVRIFNTSTSLQNIVLTANSSSNINLDLNETALLLKPKSSKLIMGTLTAKSFGKGVIKVSASVAGTLKKFYSKVELPITSSFALQTKVFKGETATAKSFVVDKNYFSTTKTKLYMNLSNSYLSQLQGSFNTLVGYPYGCAEQTSSKMLAMLFMNKFIKKASSGYLKDLLADRKRFIKDGIYKLFSMQKQSGAFGYWKSSGYVNPYASIYASDILLELKSKGFDIPNKMIYKIYKALRNQSKGYGNYKYEKISNFQRMYAAYLLSRENELSQATANALYDQKTYKNGLASRYMMAAILKTSNLVKPLNKIFKEIESFNFNQLSNKRLLGGSFYSKTKELSFALYLHVTNFKKNILSKRLLEYIATNSKNLYSTQDKAFLIRAMAAYYKTNANTKMSTNISYNNKITTYNSPTTKEDNLTTPKIVIQPNSGTVNYTFEVSNYIPKKLLHIPIWQQVKGLKLYRTYVNENNDKINLNKLKLGDLFYSKIIIKSNKKLKNIVISNRIPACFEIVNERLQKRKRSIYVKNSSEFKPAYEDFLDDKVLTFLNLAQVNEINGKKISNQQTFYQPMRVTTKGECQFPAVVAEAMYDSRITAYDKEYKKIFITKKINNKQASNGTGLKQKW